MASLVQKSSVRYMLHVTLPKWPINPFKPVQQSRQQVLRAYCPNIYTVGQGQPSYIPTFDFDYNFGFFVPGRNTQQKQKKWSDTGEHCLEKQLCEKNPLKLHVLFFVWEFLTGKVNSNATSLKIGRDREHMTSFIFNFFLISFKLLLLLLSFFLASFRLHLFLLSFC